MVKPSKTMLPEAVDLKKAGRDAGKAFGQDSFRNYMARKIDLQREQFGFKAPPDPRLYQTEPELGKKSESEKRPEVRFAPTVQDKAPTRKRKRNKTEISGVLRRLKRRHGRVCATKSQRKHARKNAAPNLSHEKNSDDALPQHDTLSPKNTLNADVPESVARLKSLADSVESNSDATITASTSQLLAKSSSPSLQSVFSPKQRPDLFLTGVVIQVDGHTNPDAETLKRLLHRHGGDLEIYETDRVTHIIAENLSTAKANIYKKQKRPIPVCYPSWIEDCVAEMTRLPHADYLIKEVQDKNTSRKGLTSYFGTASSTAEDNVQTKLRARRSPDDAEASNKETLDNSSNAPATTANRLNSRDDRSNLCKSAIPATELKKDQQSSPQIKNNESARRTCGKYINRQVRTVGTDPNFLESFFNQSRLSFIGSFKQRTRQSSPIAKSSKLHSRQRFVFHVDMDCFFVSVVLRNFEQYRNMPVAISHQGLRSTSDDPRIQVPKDSTSECATCNYKAREFGVKKGMYLRRAKQLCPNLVVLGYDFDGYEEVSEQVTNILYRYVDNYGGCIEEVSCDEAYIELHLGDRDDDCYHIAGDIAESIRNDIFEKTQCTASIGVASNKLLAKLATDRAKPDGSFVSKEYSELLRDLKLLDLPGIGYRIGQKLDGEGLVYVQDIWDLGSQGEVLLCQLLGPGLGKKITSFCRGRDERPVKPAERKTIGAECNYGVRFNGPYGVDHMLEGLAREVERRMEHVGVKGSKVTLKTKQKKKGAGPAHKFLGHGSCHNLSRSTDTPDVSLTRDSKIISSLCIKMFEELAVSKDDVRGMGIVVSNLVSDNTGSVDKDPKHSITNWFSEKAPTFTSTKDTLQRVQNDGTTTDITDMDVCQDSSESTISVTAVSKEVEILGSGHEASSPSGASIDESRDNCEIDLPSLSQIDMKQVELLPSPMRRQVMFKIDNEKAVTKYRPDTSPNKDQRFRQTDVERLLRLAAVKSGQASLGDSVALSQLENLPLKLQLQVANEDNKPIGKLLPERDGRRAKAAPKTTSNEKSTTSGNRHAPIVVDAGQAAITSDLLPSPEPGSFFRENILPLSIFMDENPVADEEAICHIGEFFSVCVNENRPSDVVIFLRTMKNRADNWSHNKVLEPLLKIVEKSLGASIDKDWLFQGR